MIDNEPEDQGRRLSGKFWLADQQDAPVGGALDLQAGTVRLDRELVSCREEVSWTPEAVQVRPRRDTEEVYPLRGRLDDGTAITLLKTSRGSCDHRSGREWQEFLVLRCIIGDHITEDTAHETAEIAFDDPWSRWLHGADVAADMKIAGAGEVTITVRDGRLVARTSSLMTAEQWSRRVTDPFCALLMLVSGHGVTVSETVLRRPGEPEVRQVPVRDDAPDPRSLHHLITSSELVPDVLSAWFAFVHQTVPVPMVLGQSISRPLGTVELDVLVLAACAEAIHREVFDDSRTSFRERLKRLVDHVDDLAEPVSGLDGERRQGWLDRVRSARNSFAHVNRSSPEDLYVHTGEMLALCDSLRWLLTAVVLQHVGIPPARVMETIKSDSAFRMFQRSAAHRLPAVYDASNG